MLNEFLCKKNLLAPKKDGKTLKAQACCEGLLGTSSEAFCERDLRIHLA